LRTKLVGVLVRGGGVVLGGEPPVVAVVVGLGLGGLVEMRVEVPFAHVAGGITLGAEELGEGDLARAQVHLAALRDPREHAVPVRSAAGEDGRARRAADGARRVALGEACALAGEGVEVGGLDHRVPVDAEVAPAEVVGEEDHDVRRARGRGAKKRGEQ
jgi:hypothetical protein